MIDASDNTTSLHAQDVEFVEISSRRMIEEINTRNFIHPIFDLAVADFRSSRVEAFAPTETLQGHLDTFRQMATETPEYRMCIDHMSTDVLEGGQFAKVYLTITATGRPPGLTRETLAILTWRRDDGEKGGNWKCISHDSMRNFAV